MQFTLGVINKQSKLGSVLCNCKVNPASGTIPLGGKLDKKS